MQFGSLSGLINGTEQVVFDYEVTGSDASTISTGNILNGNEDGWYTIIIRVIGAATPSSGRIRFNGDSGTNYGYRETYAGSTTVANEDFANFSGLPLSAPAAGRTHFQVMNFYAKSGAVRIVNFSAAADITGTTVNYIFEGTAVWNNTADNITSISLESTAAAVYGVGTRVIILKSNNFTNGTPTGVITTPYIKGSWVRVGTPSVGSTIGSITLGSASNGISFSNLDGDRDVIYLVSAYMVGPGTQIRCSGTLNGDTGTNYGRQRLLGRNTTVGASRAPWGWFECANNGTFNRAQFNYIIFAKKGFLRPILCSCIEEIAGTTVDGIVMEGNCWTNTSDNITDIAFKFNETGNAQTGTMIDLYALRPNG